MAQLDFSFNTGDLTLNEIRQAVCDEFGYEANIANPLAGLEGQPATIPNPQTKAQFLRKQVKRFLLNIVEARRVKAATAAAALAIQRPAFDPTDTD